jgi:hypothetical protein
MGLAMRVAQFEQGSRPELGQVVARTEAIGGLALAFDGHHVRFVAIPDVTIAIAHSAYLPPGPNRPPVDAVGLTDYSGESLLLMDLLSHGLIELGGTMDPVPRALPLPLTVAYVRRQQRKVRWMLRGGCLFLSILAVLGAAGIAVLAWSAWRG